MKATLKCNPERLPDRGMPTKDIYVKHDLPDLPITVIPSVKPSKPKKPKKRTKAFVPVNKNMWTPENDAELMRRYWNGESYEDIGKAIGRSAKAVKIRANAIRNEQGKRPRRVGKSMFWQESEDKILIEMFESGNGYKDIAKKLGRTYLAIATRIKVLRDMGMQIEKKMKEAKKPIKLLCNPQKLPKPRLVKNDKPEGQKSKRDWSKVNRGANNGKYGRPVFWTDARCAVLRQLKEEGKSYKEIAEEMGKSSEACRRQWYVINGYCLNGRK